MKSRDEIVAIDKKNIWRPYTPMGPYLEAGRPLVIERAFGSRIYDKDGRSYLDANSSWWTALLGHNHPRLVDALKRQADKFCHVAFAGVAHEPAAEFSEKLLRRAPPGLTRLFFSDNGSTAVEAGLKMALQYFYQNGYPEKVRAVSLQGAFHGETLGVTALGGMSEFSRPFRSLTSWAHHLPSPADDLAGAIAALQRYLEEHGKTTALLVLEPLVQGVAGMKIYSPEYLRAARRLTEEHKVLLMVDEVFTGYGRTGSFWASDQGPIAPDLLASAKGLSGGLLPFAVTLATERVFEGFLGDASRAFYYGHTFCGNALGTSVASEVLKVYEEERVLEGIAPRAERLAALGERLSQQGAVRGARALGMVLALDLVFDEGYLGRSGWWVYERALEKGAYLRPLGNTVYLVPPLNIPLADLDELCAIVEDSVSEVIQSQSQFHEKERKRK